MDDVPTLGIKLQQSEEIKRLTEEYIKRGGEVQLIEYAKTRDKYLTRWIEEYSDKPKVKRKGG